MPVEMNDLKQKAEDLLQSTPQRLYVALGAISSIYGSLETLAAHGIHVGLASLEEMEKSIIEWPKMFYHSNGDSKIVDSPEHLAELQLGPGWDTTLPSQRGKAPETTPAPTPMPPPNPSPVMLDADGRLIDSNGNIVGEAQKESK